MGIQRPHHVFLCLLFFAAVFSTFHRPATAGEEVPTAAGGDTEFIRTSCNTTLYPHVCYTSLSRYANAVQQNPGSLARIAIAVTLLKVNRTASYLSNLTRVADSSATKELRDCVSNLDDAVDQIRDSLKEIRQIGAAGAGAGSVMFQVSNVQTWMSAALTDEKTCMDGFQDVAECPVKMKVCRRVAKVKKITSNALALVNSYANKGMP